MTRGMSQRPGNTFGMIAVAGVLGASAPALSTQLYMTEVPNASCTTCHVQNNVLDTFGTAVQAQLQANGAISWAGLFLRDSDNDTYSNGEELGDPCGVWRPGATPRFTNGITDPGDAASHPNMPTIGLCGGGSSSAPGSSAGVSSSGVASSQGGSSSQGGASSADPGSSAPVQASSVDNTASGTSEPFRQKTPLEQIGCGGNHAAGVPGHIPLGALLLLGLARVWRRRA